MDRERLKKYVCTKVDSIRDDIVTIGESIMDTPELGYKEFRTAETVKQTLEGMGLTYEDGLGITGVKAVLRGARPGPTIALMGILVIYFIYKWN